VSEVGSRRTRSSRQCRSSLCRISWRRLMTRAANSCTPLVGPRFHLRVSRPCAGTSKRRRSTRCALRLSGQTLSSLLGQGMNNHSSIGLQLPLCRQQITLVAGDKSAAHEFSPPPRTAISSLRQSRRSERHSRLKREMSSAPHEPAKLRLKVSPPCIATFRHRHGSSLLGTPSCPKHTSRKSVPDLSVRNS